MAQECEVIVAGHICIDLIPKFAIGKVDDLAGFLLPGKLITVDEMVISSGGAVSNTGLNLKRLGIDVRLMGKVGNDFLGRGLLDFLQGKGVSEQMIVAEGEVTSYSIVIAPPGIDRIFLHNPGANDTFSSDDIDYEQVSASKIFHLGYPPLMRNLYQDDGAELIKIFQRAKSLGVTTSLDMSLPDPDSDAGKVNWEGILQRLLPHVDIFLPSAEESMFILNRDRLFAIKQQAGANEPLHYYDIADFEWMGSELVSQGAKIVLIKAGHRGAYLKTAPQSQMAKIAAMAAAQATNWSDRELWVESAQPVRFSSTTGSGDSFIAGFLAALLRNRSLEDSLAVANCVACQNITEMDATSGVKPWNETCDMISGLTYNKIEIKSDRWHYDGSGGIWTRESR